MESKERIEANLSKREDSWNINVKNSGTFGNDSYLNLPNDNKYRDM